MFFRIFFLFSIFNPDPSFQADLYENRLEREIYFQNENYIQNLKTYQQKRVACALSFYLHNKNRIEESIKYQNSCKKLGKKYFEMAQFLKIRNKLYSKATNTIYNTKLFEKKYPDSIFLDDVKQIRARAYFQQGYYQAAYFEYKDILENIKVSGEQERRINYVMAFCRTKFLKDKPDIMLANLNLMEHDNMLPDIEHKKLKIKVKNYKWKEIDKVIENLIKDKQWYTISRWFSLLRRYLPNHFSKILKKQSYFEKYSDLYLNFNLNRYWFIKDNLSFKEKEKILDKLEKKVESNSDKYRVLFQKAVLYRRAKKDLKRAENYRKISEIKRSKWQKAKYRFREAVYLFEGGKKKEAIKKFNTIIEDYSRWYSEHVQTLWLLFKISKDEKNRKNMKLYLDKLKKTYLKMAAYYYLIKEKLETDKENLEKYSEYFSKRGRFFYSKMVQKETDSSKNGWKNWKKLAIFQKITPKKFKLPNKRWNLYKLTQYLKDEPEIKMVKNLSYVRADFLIEKILRKFYKKVYKIRYKTKERKLDDEQKEFKKRLKKVKNNYLFPILNFLIAMGDYQYPFLLLHRHFKYLYSDKNSIYRYYFHPYAYKKYIDKYSKLYNVNPLLILSIIETESIFNSEAVSSAGAVGLMQIMPATGRKIAESLGIKKYNLYNPEDSIKFGTYYISQLLKRFNYQVPFAAGSYNGGPHNMHRWFQKHKKDNLKIDEMIDNIGFRETRHYAKKIIRLLSTYRDIYQNKKTIIPIEVSYEENKTINY